ncbi:family 20 glycosylhydrolase [Nonomuraea angiospora]|uniref:family 20 glycosylhydrolase n=1 Tax=Nonomuraea angiospora TaxID=46172 RepID=UPI00342B271A
MSPCGDESYEATVSEDGIACRARTPEGVFRAATTALQLVATGRETACRQIVDAPRFAWRGVMLDPARAFISPDELRRLIDLAALYKLNVLHLHLSDNQGWRLQLPGLPELTADGVQYSVDDYRDLQDYAAERFITVIPEIDLPGHCAALRGAFPGLREPQLADDGLMELKKRAEKYTRPETPPLDLADAETHELVGRVLKEVCALRAGPYVHIGADEVFGLPDESFAHAVRELRALVRASGKRPVAWQESSRAGVAVDDIAQFWTDPSMPPLVLDGLPTEIVELAEATMEELAETANDVARVVAGGGRVLLSPSSHLYLDRPYPPEVRPEAQADLAARLGFPLSSPRGVEHAASWDPAAHGIPDGAIAGVETALWGESITCFDDLCTLLLPRLPGTAETAWSGAPAPWEEYRVRLAGHAAFWADLGLAFFASREVPWRAVE